jgi:glycosyltransferase involved in cell wall biosynthesis
LIQPDHNGLLAASGDPAAFIRQLERLIEDDELRGRLGRAARQTVEEQFTDDRVARLSVEYYQEVVNS